MSLIYTILLYTLIGGVVMLFFASSVYLLLRRNNVFDSNITPPLRLRRWTAVFFATAGVSHLWWLFVFYAPIDDYLLNRILICTGLDTITVLPIMLCTMLVMLQDRRRPLWPVALIVVAALAGLLMVYMLGIKKSLIPELLFFMIILCITITMVIDVRQYGCWLRDNYADLEHKEVWQTFIVMGIFLLTTIFYALALEYIVFEFLIEMSDILLIVVLLWRVETLQTLDEHVAESIDSTNIASVDPIFEKLESLLQYQCVEDQYYLHHDLSLTQLSKHIGTNSTYLSRHFSQKGITYNTYINNLRIEHFIRLYQEALTNRRKVTARQLAFDSGFHSYSTFSFAFKQYMGQNVTKWMNEFSFSDFQNIKMERRIS